MLFPPGLTQSTEGKRGTVEGRTHKDYPEPEEHDSKTCTARYQEFYEAAPHEKMQGLMDKHELHSPRSHMYALQQGRQSTAMGKYFV